MIRSLLTHPVLTLVARLFIGYVFISYGIEKIIAPKDFAHSIMNYEMMPHEFVNIPALIMPWVEAICGIMLVLGIRIRTSSFLVSLMLVTFIMAISVAMARGLEINCGCSAHAEPVGVKKILEDLGYLALSLLIFFYPNAFFSLENYLQKQTPQTQTVENGVGT